MTKARKGYLVRKNLIFGCEIEAEERKSLSF